jgi:hypothetical protein
MLLLFTVRSLCYPRVVRYWCSTLFSSAICYRTLIGSRLLYVFNSADCCCSPAVPSGALPVTFAVFSVVPFLSLICCAF